MKNPLISAKQLKELIDLKSQNLIIIDTRKEEAYNTAHIPGAINNHAIFTYVSSEELGGLEGFQDTFTEIFGNAGISDNDTVVIYEDSHNTGYGQSCRGYFILNYLGHTNTLILNGGFQGWLLEKLEVTSLIPEVVRKNFTPKLDKSLIVTTEEMLRAVKEKDVVILDNRDRDEWEGKSSSPYGIDYCPRKGRIPGAVWIEWYSLMKDTPPDPMFLDKEDILKKCSEVGITQDTPVYVYCFKGSRASNTMLALQLAGIKNVKNYFESWNVWSRDFDLPIDDKKLNV